MHSDMVESYIEKIYAFAINHTYFQEEADELSQEILCTIVRQLPTLRDQSKLDAWIWGVARNVTKSYRRSMGKRRAMYFYDVPENILADDPFDNDQEELLDSLRTKIAMLSAIYREIILLYYYDGLSTKLISQRLNVPEGTVTWRLSEARKKIKKECLEMTETALRPVKMRIDIYGSGNYDGKTIPFPTVYIDDALSQNILYHCYEKAATVEELAKLCGAPAYYIEERIENLVKREAMVEASKGKYQTDFLIWSDKYGIYCEQNAEKLLMPMMDRMLQALRQIAQKVEEIDFYRAEKDEADLFYLYAVMAFDFARKHYCNLPYPRMKKKYDGNEWCYLGNMETGNHHRIGIGTQHSANLGSRGGYSHTSYFGIHGIAFRPMMCDRAINACEDILHHRSSDDIDAVTKAIQEGYIIRRPNGEFFVTAPAFTKEQKADFDSIADQILAPQMPEYSEIVNRFLSGYKKLFPKHLNDDADRMCHQMFFGLCAAILEYAQKKQAIPMPSPNCYCDVLIQFK